jgi:transposase-like protein
MKKRMAATWHIPMLRSLLLWGAWEASGRMGPDWLQLLPWAVWIIPGEWKLGQIMRQMERWVIWGYLGLGLLHWSQTHGLLTGLPLGMGWQQSRPEGTEVKVEREGDGSYRVKLRGEFNLHMMGDPFRVRMLMVFLGLLETGGEERCSRRTRDGRTPFVRQEELASWFGQKQECISRYMKYWLTGNWANLLSLKTEEVLTVELVERIVKVSATFPDWGVERVYQHLREQGIKVSHEQVKQARQESGWAQLQVTLLEGYDLKAGLRLKDEWLVAQLLSQVQFLLEKVEAGQGLAVEERCSIQDVQTLAAQAKGIFQPALPAQPWLQPLERIVLGTWEQATESTVHCIYCGSKDVGRKSNQGRRKKFCDAQGQVQEVNVYRYYCHNPQCAKKSFTHLPTGLVPYSPYRAQVHLLALQMYACGHSAYRYTAKAMGVPSMTVWRWVNAWGHDLLPIAAMFGVIKSSGVVGVDEKYVLVPKNDKPDGKMRRWMYVYVAVDLWTYDLLHIQIYPYNDENSAKAFLFALRAKGYHPDCIVTDLRQDYGPVISLIFPAAQHHECIFHALQNVQKHIKDVYGSKYAETHPEAAALKQKIYDIFDTSSSSEALDRYLKVLLLKLDFLNVTPDSVVIFDFLEHHWPKLVNAIGSDTIPTTNNVTELVIRRFDQHYQNFCGFQSIDTARSYLAIFEKLYRFTPFSQDAQLRIRDKSPLQLAGYDISHIPMSTICSGLSVVWPTEANLVPY